MKRFLSLSLCLLMLVSSFALADTYTVEEVLPSIPSYTDEELATLIDAAEAEIAAREAAAQEDAQAAIAEDEAYVERPTVQRGDKGDEVKALQERLIELGFLAGTADGDFGSKSEAAVKSFQKANGLEETGIADSMTQHVLYSAQAVDEEAYESKPIATGDGWEITKEYYYSTSWYHYYIFLLKNTSGYNADISVNVYFYDAEDNLVGVANGSESACENGYTTCWSFSNDVAFDHATYEISMSEDSWYKDGGQSSLELSSSIVGKKVILSAKNIGSETVQFVEYHVLFLNKNGKVVNTGWGFLTDDDSELKPGATEMREESCSEEFSDVQFFAHGRINK